MDNYFETIKEQRRARHEEKRHEIQKKEAELRKWKNRLKTEYRAGNRAINELMNHPTKHSVQSHRKRDAYNIKRVIEGKLAEWGKSHLEMENAVIGFNFEEGKVVFNITIPYKHSAYEDQLDLF